MPNQVDGVLLHNMSGTEQYEPNSGSFLPKPMISKFIQTGFLQTLR
jgi:hypothetical protein